MKNLTAAIVAVMSKVGSVAKTGHNAFHRYDYASEADLLRALQPVMTEAGLVLLPVVVDSRTIEAGTDRKQQTRYRTDVLVTYRLLHTSGESIDLQAPGSGMDPEDKGAYKAMTGALKYVLRQAFLIPTGDDPDDDKREPEHQQQTRREESPTAKNTQSPPSASAPPPAPVEEVDEPTFRRYWFARFTAAAKLLGVDAPTDSDRHASQMGIFSKESLKDLTNRDRVLFRAKLGKTTDERLAELLKPFVIPF